MYVCINIYIYIYDLLASPSVTFITHRNALQRTAPHWRTTEWPDHGHAPLLRVLCHFTGFVRRVWGRPKCSPSFLIERQPSSGVASSLACARAPTHHSRRRSGLKSIRSSGFQFVGPTQRGDPWLGPKGVQKLGNHFNDPDVLLPRHSRSQDDRGYQIPRGCQDLVTPAPLGYRYQFSIKTLLSK